MHLPLACNTRRGFKLFGIRSGRYFSLCRAVACLAAFPEEMEPFLDYRLHTLMTWLPEVIYQNFIIITLQY